MLWVRCVVCDGDVNVVVALMMLTGCCAVVVFNDSALCDAIVGDGHNGVAVERCDGGSGGNVGNGATGGSDEVWLYMLAMVHD